LIQMGYILVAVWITALGEVTGEAVDYFVDPHECWQEAVWEMEVSEPGVSFTCVLDGLTLEQLEP